MNVSFSLYDTPVTRWAVGGIPYACFQARVKHRYETRTLLVKPDLACSRRFHFPSITYC
jgi:hypothetical protein